jgi:hypothetical protein
LDNLSVPDDNPLAQKIGLVSKTLALVLLKTSAMTNHPCPSGLLFCGTVLPRNKRQLKSLLIFEMPNDLLWAESLI